MNEPRHAGRRPLVWTEGQLRATLVVAAHHLRRMVKRPGRIALLAAIPVTIALIEYAAFAPTAASGKLPPIRVLILDEDQTPVSGGLPQVFTRGPMRDAFTVSTIEDRKEARPLFEKNEASALVVVPKGFQQAILDGGKAELVIYKNPVQTFSPQIVESVLEITATLGNGLYGQVQQPIGRIRDLVDADREPTEAELAEIVLVSYRALRDVRGVRGLDGIGVRVERPTGETTSAFGTNPREFFAVLFPGLVIFNLLFVSQALALGLLRDRAEGRLRRLVATPPGARPALLGGLLYAVVGLAALLVVLGLIGALIFRIQLRHPIGLLVFAFGFAAFAAGLQLAIVGLVRSDKGAQAISGAAAVLLSLLGGSFVPAEQYPPLLRTLASILPNGAAQQGMVDLLVHGKTLADLLPKVALVWLSGLLLLGVSYVVERRRLAA